MSFSQSQIGNGILNKSICQLKFRPEVIVIWSRLVRKKAVQGVNRSMVAFLFRIAFLWVVIVCIGSGASVIFAWIKCEPIQMLLRGHPYLTSILLR